MSSGQIKVFSPPDDRERLRNRIIVCVCAVSKRSSLTGKKKRKTGEGKSSGCVRRCRCLIFISHTSQPHNRVYIFPRSVSERVFSSPRSSHLIRRGVKIRKTTLRLVRRLAPSRSPPSSSSWRIRAAPASPAISNRLVMSRHSRHSHGCVTLG